MAASGRRRWGWHRLADDWARQLVAGAGIRPGDLVLDIGAGTGALTAPLVHAGARVVAFELHPERARHLRGRFAGAPVTVVQADATDVRLPRRAFRVVANPPFGVTAAVLRRLVSPGSRLLRADVVVPWHVADRWSRGQTAGAARWSRAFRAQVVCRLPRAAFRPPPPNGTAVLKIVRIGG